MNVLFLTHRLPYAPNRGDRIRAYHLLHHLARRHQVSLLSLVHDDAEAGHVADLRHVCADLEIARVPRVANLVRGATQLAGDRPLTHALLSSPAILPTLNRLASRRPPDAVLAYCSSMGQYVFAPPIARVPFVLDMADVDSAKWAQQAAATRPPMRWVYAREQKTLSAFERRVSAAAHCTLVTNERERRELAAIANGADIRVLENGIDVKRFAPPYPAGPSSTVVFTGVMDYAPNVEAVIWLATAVWPAVRAARPDARLAIVGASPTSAVKALGCRDITVTGSVPDTRPYLWDGAVAVAPLQRARGVQNKVLEAVAAGLPAVVTPIVAEGLPPEVTPAIDVAGDAHAFAHAVLALLAQAPEERRARVQRAALMPLSWDARLASLEAIMREASARQRSA